MAKRKTGTTLDALNARIAALQARADAIRKKEVSEVIAKIEDAIAHYGLTATDLGFGEGARKSAKSSAVGGAGPARRRSTKAGPQSTAKTVKFKDDQGNTWGGRGKRPAWFKAALASGKTPEDLLAKG